MHLKSVSKLAALLALAGAAPSHAIDLACLHEGSMLILKGINNNDRCGRSVAAAGDVNGDGIDDVIVGAMYADPNGIDRGGESYVVFGGNALDETPSIDLATLDGANGFIINGVHLAEFTGISVSSAGDVNGDGFADVIVGGFQTFLEGPNTAGKGYVVFGGADVGNTGVIELASLDGTNGFTLNGVEPGDQCGISVSSAGDINEDGLDDLIIGAQRASSNGIDETGASYVVFGRADIGSGGSIELASLDGTDGFVINGVAEDDRVGFPVSSAGDVNADGVADLIIGARHVDVNGAVDAGASYVVFGGAGVGSTGSIDLASLDGTNGFILNGAEENDNTGVGVSSAGDLNGDGVGDLVIGAFTASPNGIVQAGASYVVFGGAGVGAAGSIELASLHGANGFILTGISEDDLFGVSVSSAGDLNDDGIDDLIIGANQASANGNSTTGICYVVFGDPGVGATGEVVLSSLNGTNGFRLTGISAFDRFGNSVSNAGDLNNDGVEDIVVGAPRANGDPFRNAGECYIIFGGSGVGANDPSNVVPLGDINTSCEVNSDDLAILLANWGEDDADLNGDGVTDSADLAILIAAWTG